MNLIKPVPVESCGIKLLNAGNGRELSWGMVNKHLADVLNPTLEELADHGAIAIYTYGIRNNRLIRGSSTTTSTHSNGLHSNGYKHWRDGSVGALGIDIRKVLFDSPATIAGIRLKHVPGLPTSLVVTDPGDLAAMIQWLEARDWNLYHKKLGSVNPYHLHGERAGLKAMGVI